MSDRYEIREEIGKGGLGAVYKAFDTQLQREVAMKRVLSTDSGTQEEVDDAARKLIAEAQTLSSLNHPNIVTVFDVGQDEKGGFVVMELLKGETLDETVERGVLTQEDFTEVVYQTMEALIAAQASNVIHRDIKPTNIMVIWQASGKFQTKILDFGLAKFSKSPSVQTMDQEDSVMGSIFFMSPEQFERGELDARTDLYQMGCVYYHALTGQYPFNGETAPQVMNAHLQHKVIPLENIRPDLPPSVCQWVMWLINRDIEHRPVDAREALKHWPRNPEPPGSAAPLEALPVEDTPEVISGQVKIVTSAHQASAPPSLIVTPSGHTTGHTRLATGSGAQTVGSRSQRLSGATGPRTGGVYGGSSSGSKAKLWIVLASIVCIVGIFSGVLAVKSSQNKKKEARLVELAASEKPVGTPEDVELAISYLSDPSYSTDLRANARKVLVGLTGAGVDQKILEQLQSSESANLRIQLSSVLSERDYAPAVPAMIDAFRSATNDDQRVRILTAVRSLAEMKSIDQMLDALQGEHSLTVRKVFENTVLTVLRKNDNPDSVIEGILSRLSKTRGSERKSLFRILGVIGGQKVQNRLTTIYNKEQDLEMQRDGMLALLSWQSRSILPLVEGIMQKTRDKALRTASERAYVRLAGLPGPEPIEQRIEIWQKAFGLLSNPNDYRDLISSMVEYPSAESAALLRTWEEDPKYGKLAKAVAETIEKMIAGSPAIEPNTVLQGNQARIMGDKEATINTAKESITNWTSPETWFAWNFKVKTAGQYSVAIEQSTIRNSPSDFVVYLAGQAFPGESQATNSFDDFKEIKLDGTVQLEAGKLYTIFLAAGEIVQPRMMDIGGVRLFVK